jgi:hypothetical protein
MRGRKSVHEMNCDDQVDFCPFRGPDAPLARENINTVGARRRGPRTPVVHAAGKRHEEFWELQSSQPTGRRYYSPAQSRRLCEMNRDAGSYRSCLRITGKIS